MKTGLLSLAITVMLLGGLLGIGVSFVAASAVGWSGVDEGYTVTGLHDGEYRITTQAESCTKQWFDSVYGMHDVTVPMITGGAPATVVSLQAGGTISGRVIDSQTSKGISNVHVNAHDYMSGEWVAGTDTDHDGYYTLVGVPTGSYRVQTHAHGSGVNYADEFYDNTYCWHEARPVHVTAPGNTPNINFSLEVGGTISGTVRDQNTGLPLANISVDCGRRHTCGGGGATTNQHGKYTVTGLPFGQYQVGSPSGGRWGSGDQDYARQYRDASITADLPNATGVDFTLEIGGTISGRVVDSLTSKGISGVHVNAHDRTTDEWLAGTDTDPNGYYTLVGLPTGSYIVRTHAAGSGLSYVDKYYDARYRRHEADPVYVTAPDNTANINFSLEAGGSISGRVMNSINSEGIAGVHVSAQDYETGEWVAGTDTNIDGYYTLLGLPTGSYRVRTHARGYANSLYDDVYHRDQAKPVEVTVPDDTGGIDFSLEPTVPRGTLVDAIADGVAWLASHQNPNGSWSTYYQVAKTALAVLVLETHAADIGMSGDPAYPYREHIDQGFRFLFSHAYITKVTLQPAGNPDSNGNGIGVYFRSPAFPPDRGHAYDIYETSIALMAVGAAARPGRAVTTPGSVVNGWSFADVAQDVVDYLAWAQTDFGFGRGSWNYHPMDNQGDRSDQSNAGWVTLGLMYAEDSGSTIPGFVRSELDIWIDYIQDKSGGPNDGGSEYTGVGDPDYWSWVNMLKTGNLLQQMAFVGDTEKTLRVQAAVDYLLRHWGPYHTCYHTTYTVMKGLEQLGIETINSIDWFQGFVDSIMSEQSADGSWMPGDWDYAARVLSATWALLTLQKQIPPTRMGPDLIILKQHGEWVDEGQGTYTVHFTVKNRGNVEAPSGHHVGLIVNDVMVEEKAVPAILAPGDTYDDSFDTVLTQSLLHDKITVLADIHEAVDELNMENNHSTDIWPPFGPLVRSLPLQARPGDELEVTLTFISPHDEFNSVELTDVAPPGWTVSVDTAWATPSPLAASAPTAEKAVYVWAGPYDAGVDFTVVYRVRVPADAQERTYSFDGSLKYYIDPHPEPAYLEETFGDNLIAVIKEHILTVSSTQGGSVVMPGEGTFEYGEGTLVSLVAESDGRHRFINWTGDVATIDDVDAAQTSIKMEGDYSITANFGAVSGCFIATASYGTPMAEEVQILREFRDRYLLTNRAGKTFVGFYYTLSPPIAGLITEHAGLRSIVRTGLVPAVEISTLALSTTPAVKAVTAGLLALVSTSLAAWATRRRSRGPQCC